MAADFFTFGQLKKSINRERTSFLVNGEDKTDSAT